MRVMGLVTAVLIGLGMWAAPAEAAVNIEVDLSTQTMHVRSGSGAAFVATRPTAGWRSALRAASWRQCRIRDGSRGTAGFPGVDCIGLPTEIRATRYKHEI